MRYLFAFCFLFVAGIAYSGVPDSVYVVMNYDKMEVSIPMRDGVKLFTSIYVPKDKTKKFPFLMQRTCYSVAPYGGNQIQEVTRPFEI